MKRLICLTLILSLFSFTCFADAGEYIPANSLTTEYYSEDLQDAPIIDASSTILSTPPQINAKGYVLMEKSTGQTLAEYNSHEKLAPASITKIMTILLVVEAIDNGNVSLDDIVTASAHACSMGGSQIWLEPGETMTVDEMLKAAVVGSANDASVALAEHIAGSEEAFVSLMNKRAKELNMKDTNFVNACGLDTEGHYTSAYDVAIMSRELISHDLIKKYSTIWMDTLRGGDTQLVNTNKLVRFYTGCTGLKTGTTNNAGHCLSVTAKRDDMELIAVVMGGASSNDRFSGGKQLLDYGFSNWKLKQPDFNPSKLKDVTVVKGVKKSVPVENESINNVLVSVIDNEEIAVKSKVKKKIKAPVLKGDVVGNLDIMSGDKLLQRCKVVATEDIPEITFIFSFKLLLNKLFSI